MPCLVQAYLKQKEQNMSYVDHRLVNYSMCHDAKKGTIDYF